ncbi:hypothetical protein VZT92_005806 [Zoarces viviparus]|uniref:Uncharacterized protein n=1 Tax=Zoarces viviparus TaxID=48416 RepID=A0AAW1FMX4_ZOAVI
MKGALLLWDPKGAKLAHMFSTWLVSGILPMVLRHCRTSLIPKMSEVSLLSDINQWRPITIASIVLRLFSRVLPNRMTTACSIHLRQRGFVKSPGCSEKLMILENLIRTS